MKSFYDAIKINEYEKTGMVTYRSKMTHGKNKKDFSISTAEEFVAAITEHIPEPSLQMVRYGGWSSNRMRGDGKKQDPDAEEKRTHGEETEIIDGSEYKPRKIPPPTWPECLKKVWEVDQ